MFSALLRWFQGTSSRTHARLVVEGTVVETGTHQPRTHLGPRQAPQEAFLALDVSRASLSTGAPRSAASIHPPEFSGPLSLLEQVSVGDRVRITATTPTGREVLHLEHLNPDDG